MTPSIADADNGAVVSQPLFRVGLVSDIQYADLDNMVSPNGNTRFYRATLSSLERAVTDWNVEDVNFVLHCGDIIDCRTTYFKNSEIALQRILERLKKLKSPLKHVIGNHCVYCFGQSAALKKLDVQNELGYYSFQPISSWRFVVLNTSDISLFSWPAGHPNTKQAEQILHENNPKTDKGDPEGLIGLNRRFVNFNGGVSKDQLDWFTKELELAEENSQKVVVFTHIPIYPDSVKPACLVWNYDTILDVIQNQHPGVVKAVISGHTHEWSHGRDKFGVQYLTLPGMLEQPPAVPGHGIMDVYGDHICIKGFGWDGPFNMKFDQNWYLNAPLCKPHCAICNRLSFPVQTMWEKSPRVMTCKITDLTDAFHIKHSTATETVKGEDIVFHESGSGYKLFAICDGHAGVKCASFVKAHFWKILEPKLPVLSSLHSVMDASQICKQIRNAILTSFLELDGKWYAERSLSGTTLSIALVLGRLLTTANVGDSEIYLHTGGDICYQLTRSHRLQKSTLEQKRLNAAGVQLAPLRGDLRGPAVVSKERGLGPLRVWPGGLAVSRSIGDADVSPQVLCVPHIRQLIIPSTGGRVILATDGLYDYLATNRIKKIMKRNTIRDCANLLVRSARVVHGNQLQDDVTVCTFDLVSHQDEDFSDVVKRHENSKGALEKLINQVVSLGSCKLRKRVNKSKDCEAFLADVDGLNLISKENGIKKMELIERCDSVLLTTNEFTLHGGRKIGPLLATNVLKNY
eukprot:g8411.t1